MPSLHRNIAASVSLLCPTWSLLKKKKLTGILLWIAVELTAMLINTVCSCFLFFLSSVQGGGPKGSDEYTQDDGNCGNM